LDSQCCSVEDQRAVPSVSFAALTSTAVNQLQETWRTSQHHCLKHLYQNRHRPIHTTLLRRRAGLQPAIRPIPVHAFVHQPIRRHYAFTTLVPVCCVPLAARLQYIVSLHTINTSQQNTTYIHTLFQRIRRERRDIRVHQVPVIDTVVLVIGPQVRRVGAKSERRLGTCGVDHVYGGEGQGGVHCECGRG